MDWVICPSSDPLPQRRARGVHLLQGAKRTPGCSPCPSPCSGTRAPHHRDQASPEPERPCSDLNSPLATHTEKKWHNSAIQLLYIGNIQLPQIQSGPPRVPGLFATLFWGFIPFKAHLTKVQFLPITDHKQHP